LVARLHSPAVAPRAQAPSPRTIAPGIEPPPLSLSTLPAGVRWAIYALGMLILSTVAYQLFIGG
jgi:hypothetical protein